MNAPIMDLSWFSEELDRAERMRSRIAALEAEVRTLRRERRCLLAEIDELRDDDPLRAEDGSVELW